MDISVSTAMPYPCGFERRYNIVLPDENFQKVIGEESCCFLTSKEMYDDDWGDATLGNYAVTVRLNGHVFFNACGWIGG